MNLIRIGMFLITIMCMSVISTGQNAGQSSGISPVSLTCEYLENPMVIDVMNPGLTWVNTASQGQRGQVQTAYQIQVASSKDKILEGNADLWDSEKINSEKSVRVKYAGKELVSRQDCWWRVRVWDGNGNVSQWSQPAFWSMGLLNANEWTAQWIGAPWQGDEPTRGGGRGSRGGRGGRGGAIAQPQQEVTQSAPLLRKGFTVNKEVASARAYVTGLGYFELYVNGKKVSDDVLVPNLTLYGKRPGLENSMISVEDNFKEYRVMYLSYDIKDMLQEGENVVGAILGNGFYNSPSTWVMQYGTPRFIGQIYVTYTDSTEDVITSDTSWKVAQGPITSNTIYNGEQYDARLEQSGWNAPGFNDSKWQSAVVRSTPEGIMKAHMSPTDKVMERLEPVNIEKLGEGLYRVDFGKEISGWLHMMGMKGEAGQRIDIRYVENNGTTAGSGSNSYIMRGEGEESYAARFTWFVFRYVELTNWPGELTADQLRAEAVNTNVPITSEFACSNDLFNTINQIWRRSQSDNMHGGIASDCPHRERSPYTGDGQVACVTVMHNFGAAAFYNKWIQDILGSQNVDTGYVPNGAPWQPRCGGGVAWGAAMNIMPWEFYLHYGDLDMLEYTYEGMKGYIRHMLTWTNEDGIMNQQMPTGRPNNWMNLGDWCAPGKMPPNEMVHTFYLWRCADFTAKAAKALGKTADAEEYAQLADKTKKAFQNKYYDAANGTYGAGGGNIFALAMGVPEEQEAKVIASLKADIAANNGNLDTGIFGTQYFFETLADYGMNDLAFEAINKRTQPSYGWWVEQGATTTWENWGQNGSHNHPMFGGGLVWFYRKLAGMNTDIEQPGYKHIIFRPEPVGDVSFAEYYYQTVYGKAGIHWEKKDGQLTVAVTVPVGSTATVYVPAEDSNSVTENGQAIANNANVSFQKMEDGYAVYSMPSGRYNFIVN